MSMAHTNKAPDSPDKFQCFRDDSYFTSASVWAICLVHVVKKKQVSFYSVRIT